jgi:hypothetical protein
MRGIVPGLVALLPAPALAHLGEGAHVHAAEVFAVLVLGAVALRLLAPRLRAARRSLPQRPESRR